jgi:hypothetical protein
MLLLMKKEILIIQEMYKASQYFVRGSHPETFAKAVVQWMHQCYPGEADLVVARAVLLYDLKPSVVYSWMYLFSDSLLLRYKGLMMGL